MYCMPVGASAPTPNKYCYKYRFGMIHATAQYTDAQADLTQCLALQPNDAKAYYARGLTRTALGDTTGAVSDLQQALRLFTLQGDSADAQKAQDALHKLGQ